MSKYYFFTMITFLLTSCAREPAIEEPPQESPPEEKKDGPFDFAQVPHDDEAQIILDQLLDSLEAQPEPKILFAGAHVFEIKADSVYEDPITGQAVATGVKQLTTSNGITKTRGNGVLTLDQSTGEGELTADSIEFHPFEK